MAEPSLAREAWLASAVDGQRWMRVHRNQNGRHFKAAMTTPLRDDCDLVEENLSHGEAFTACEIYNGQRGYVEWCIEFYSNRLKNPREDEKMFIAYFERHLARCHWALGSCR